MDADERRARITDEAAQWWMRLGTKGPGEIARAEREKFTQWLRESPVHVAELLRMTHVHDSLERFGLWDEIGVDGVDEGNVVALSASRPKEDSPRRPRARVWAIAASVCLIAVTGVWLALGVRGQTIQTDRAERREVMLDDGSVVQLEPQTLLRVALKTHERRIALAHGRALFSVAKDPQRPFFVHADRTLVRAVGTAFGVERRDSGIVVTVTEGRVAVGEKDRNEVFLTAAQQVTIPASGAAEPVRTVDTARALAWAQGRLVFENDTLAEVIAEFNRYNRAQLVIGDEQLKNRRVSGVFEASDPETLLAFIQAGSRVGITRKGTQQIVIAPMR